MTLRLSLVTSALALAAATTPAVADVLSMRAELHGGGAGGAGIAGGAKDHAFAKGASGGTYGFLLGAEILFIDAWVEHHQYTDGSLIGTWTQFMSGLDVDLELGKPALLPGAKKGAKRGRAKGYAELGIEAGFGLGTGQQVTIPLDNAQLTDKAFLIEGRFGVGYNLGPLLSVGITLPVSYGYMFKAGPGVVANDNSNRYQAIQGALMLNLRFRLKVK